VKAKLRIRCRNCGSWNTIEVEKIFLNSSTSDSKLKIFLPAYLPLKAENCSKCNQLIAEREKIIGRKQTRV
jgi:phage FluMu protein Com